MDKRKVLLIINPVAGNGKTIQQLPKIKNKIRNQKGMEIVILVSKYEGHITELVKQYFSQGYREFLGVGGDGTLSEIINGINYSVTDNIIVGIIPNGTGNDFIRNFSKDYSMEAIIDRLINRDTTKTDIGRVNDFYFINVCSLGIDGPIVKNTEKLKRYIPGMGAYLVSTIKHGISFKARTAEVKIDNVVHRNDYLLIAVGNGKYIGGGMKICPDAEVGDGKFQICLVDSVKRIRFLKKLPKIYTGKLKALDEVNYMDGETIEIKVLGDEYYINADGNIIGDTPARISIIRNAINFI